MPNAPMIMTKSILGGLGVGLAILVAGPAASFAQSGAQSGAADGQVQFNNACRTCHSTDAGDNRLGPNLHQIIGRKAGAAEGYAYSSAMKSADLVWDEATLDKFIADPDSVVPGNKMQPYNGMNDAVRREAIVGFLASQK